MKVVATHKGIIVNCANIEDNYKKLIAALTYKKRIMSGKRIIYKIAEFYRIYQLPDKKLLSIAPGAYNYNYGGCRDILGETILHSMIPPGNDIPVENLSGGVTLYGVQSVAHDYLIANFLNPEMSAQGLAKCVFVMDAGLGKSFIACGLISTIRKKTLIVVMNTNQMQQWKTDVFAKYYPKLNVGTYCGTGKKDGDVVIIVINSLCKLEANYIKTFGCIIYDEIPEFMGETRRASMWDFNLSYVVGLTATPDERLDGMDIFYKQLVGPIVRAEDIPGFSVDKIVWKGNVRVIRYSGPPKYTKRLVSATGEMNCSMMNQQFSEDPYRTKMILDIIRELYDSGKYIYVFAQTRSHLIRVRDAIVAMGIGYNDVVADALGDDDETFDSPEVSGESNVVKTLMGGASDSDIVEAKNQARIILTTYGYGSVGMSIVKMDAIIFITPRKNKMRQILGRILRRGGDHTITRDIIDVVDQKTDVKNQYSKRKKIYDEKGFIINESAVLYSSILLDDHI